MLASYTVVKLKNDQAKKRCRDIPMRTHVSDRSHGHRQRSDRRPSFRPARLSPIPSVVRGTSQTSRQTLHSAVIVSENKLNKHAPELACSRFSRWRCRHGHTSPLSFFKSSRRRALYESKITRSANGPANAMNSTKHSIRTYEILARLSRDRLP